MLNSSVAASYKFGSVVKMALWRLQKCGYPITMCRHDGSIIELRGGERALTDRWIASEIFVNKQYVPPDNIELKEVRQIVDVGANVGYSIVYFLSLFPEAKITAFEPHPAHVKQIQRHMAMNKLETHVVLYSAAAGVSEGTVALSDSDAASSIVTGNNCASDLSVPILDWYQYLPDGTIDLLKMDIEGAEFALMEDERFAGIIKRTRVFVLEWHRTDKYPDAREWCANRVQSLGMVVHDGATQYSSTAGTFWAVHP